MADPEIDDDPPETGAAVPSGRNKTSPPASIDAPDPDRLTYRTPEAPPAHGSVTIDQRDGTFTYIPKLDESD